MIMKPDTAMNDQGGWLHCDALVEVTTLSSSGRFGASWPTYEDDLEISPEWMTSSRKIEGSSQPSVDRLHRVWSQSANSLDHLVYPDFHDVVTYHSPGKSSEVGGKFDDAWQIWLARRRQTSGQHRFQLLVATIVGHHQECSSLKLGIDQQA
jgi:hypothetical protein